MPSDRPIRNVSIVAWCVARTSVTYLQRLLRRRRVVRLVLEVVVVVPESTDDLLVVLALVHVLALALVLESMDPARQTIPLVLVALVLPLSTQYAARFVVRLAAPDASRLVVVQLEPAQDESVDEHRGHRLDGKSTGVAASFVALWRVDVLESGGDDLSKSISTAFSSGRGCGRACDCDVRLRYSTTTRASRA